MTKEPKTVEEFFISINGADIANEWLILDDTPTEAAAEKSKILLTCPWCGKSLFRLTIDGHNAGFKCQNPACSASVIPVSQKFQIVFTR